MTESKLPIAILAAAGFEETTYTDFQKALLAAGHAVKVVTPDAGLVQGWHEEAWGHHFMADEDLADALSADFAGLIVPDGIRSTQTLKANLHARRFVKAFVDTGKPLLVVADAVELLAIAEVAAARRLTGPEGLREALAQAGADWIVGEAIVTHENVVTTTPQAGNGASLAAFLALFDNTEVQEAA
jgi:protease I